MNCEHVNTYRDDLVGEWHCDDCGVCFGKTKPEHVR